MYCDVLAEKMLTTRELLRDFSNLVKYAGSPTFDKGCYAGNKILYHFQFDELCKTRRENKPSFYEVMMCEDERDLLWVQANKYAPEGRKNHPGVKMFEMFRRLHGCISFFRPTIAINVYTKYNATHVLDPCAGWGGRMLGAIAKGISYTGFDTNTNLRAGYSKMIELVGGSEGDATIHWRNSLEYDFSTIDYDFVLTSPPYVNLELYSGMRPFKTKEIFYKKFLIPLLDKCRASIRRGGKVCFNISPEMYSDLLSFGYSPCLESLSMLQRGVKNKDRGEKLYIW
jgi:hypothetical protein